MDINQVKELFDSIDQSLISETVEERISEAVETHYSSLKNLNLSEDEFQKALSKVVAVETVRQAAFIACFLKMFDPNEPLDPRDFIRRVK